MNNDRGKYIETILETHTHTPLVEDQNRKGGEDRNLCLLRT